MLSAGYLHTAMQQRQQAKQHQHPCLSSLPLPLQLSSHRLAENLPLLSSSPPSSSSRQRRQQLPPLAPRDSKPSQSPRRTSEPPAGRPPRLSHRSRAGCWTCRGRKVKCDEAHPRCGPCTRLNRECDWDHRWAFNDSTPITKGKYSNVNTSGNAVWDPTVRASTFPPASHEQDDLPDFRSLTTDEDRERKAGTRRPGTFAVVATPESFYDLPEYAAVAPSNRRRGSPSSSRGARASSRPGMGRASTLPDPNTVLLDRFEESPPLSFSPILAEGSRSGSMPDILQHLNLTTPSPSITSAPFTPAIGSEEHLLHHFRHYIAPRLTQPRLDATPPNPPQDMFEQESTRFSPLHHAICAISGLNLAYNGRASMEGSMQHYHQALAVHPSACGSPHNLLSDGVFFRHFLLFIYDICIPMQTTTSSGDSAGSADMWAEHLSHLRLLALQRFHHHHGSEPHAHLIWTICELDMYACLLGCGNCDFVQTVLSHNMLPPIERQIPPLPASSNSITNTPFLPTEQHLFPAILRLNEGIVLRTAKIAQTAQVIRNEALEFEGLAIPGSVYTRWRAAAEGLHADLLGFWNGAHPKGLLGENGTVMEGLPERVTAVLEHATLLYHAATLYVLTTLHPSPPTPPAPITAHHIGSILSLATHQLARPHAPSHPPSLRPQIFALLIAAFATAPEDEMTRRRCAEVMERLERGGIGVGASRVRMVVGGLGNWRAEEGQGQGWGLVGLLRRKGVGVVNCGI